MAKKAIHRKTLGTQNLHPSALHAPPGETKRFRVKKAAKLQPLPLSLGLIGMLSYMMSFLVYGDIP